VRQPLLMAPELPPAPGAGRGYRRWLPLALAAFVILLALAVFAMRRHAASAAKPEDCETKPPPNAFAVAECDDGSAPAGARTGESSTPAAPPKP
jgi:hypothetical protein